MAEPFDIDEMATKVFNLCSNDVLLKEMANNALKNASKYTIERVGAQWLELFSKEGITA
jgi:glycosyltransferase involved in cell wall biosynthesis